MASASDTFLAAFLMTMTQYHDNAIRSSRGLARTLDGLMGTVDATAIMYLRWKFLTKFLSKFIQSPKLSCDCWIFFFFWHSEVRSTFFIINYQQLAHLPLFTTLCHTLTTRKLSRVNNLISVVIRVKCKFITPVVDEQRWTQQQIQTAADNGWKQTIYVRLFKNICHHTTDNAKTGR